MRISIWEQFSSNHSANYIVVGKFSSPTAADLAAAELKNILAQLRNWWDQPSNKSRDWGNIVDSGGLTPLEQDLSQQYEVEWKGINWYYWATSYDATEPVVTYKEFVFVHNPHPYIWYGPQPFDGLLKRFGGEVYVESDVSQSYPDTDLNILISCDAPNEATARNIEEECLGYLRTVNSETESGIPPWIGCYSGLCVPDPDDLKLHVLFSVADDEASVRGRNLRREINIPIFGKNTPKRPNSFADMTTYI